MVQFAQMSPGQKSSKSRVQNGSGSSPRMVLLAAIAIATVAALSVTTALRMQDSRAALAQQAAAKAPEDTTSPADNSSAMGGPLEPMPESVAPKQARLEPTISAAQPKHDQPMGQEQIEASAASNPLPGVDTAPSPAVDSEPNAPATSNAATVATAPAPAEPTPAFTPTGPAPVALAEPNPAVENTRPAPDVQVAETDEQAAEIEEASGMSPETPAPNASDDQTVDAPQDQVDRNEQTAAVQQPALKPARVVSWVDMRSRPRDGASTIMVVPAEARVQAETNCGWCAVEYEGKRGFIYKKFLRPD